MEINVSYPYYNTIMIFVCVFTVLWSLRILHKGISSNLVNYEGATRTHLSAIVHTRQSKPPVSMNIMQIPFLCNKIGWVEIMHKDEVRYQLNVYMDATVPMKLLLLINFQSDEFIKAVNSLNKLLVYQDNQRTDSYTKESSKTSSCIRVTQEVGHSLGYCDIEALFLQDTIWPGQNTAHFAFPSMLNQFISSKCNEQQMSMNMHHAENSLKSKSFDVELGINPVKETNQLVENDKEEQLPAQKQEKLFVAVVCMPLRMEEGSGLLKGFKNNSNCEADRLLGQLFGNDIVKHCNAKQEEFPKVKQSLLDSTNNQRMDEISDEFRMMEDVDSRSVRMKKSPDRLKGNKMNHLHRLDVDNHQELNKTPSKGYQWHHGGSPNLLDNKKIDCMAASVISLEVPLSSSITQSDETSPSVRNARVVKELQPIDLFVLDHLGNLLIGQEIFGLSSETPAPPDSNPSESKLSEIRNDEKEPDDEETKPKTLERSFISRGGGKYSPEDCVVCLTEVQEIVLLPCRHLCVCGTCLVYIDKCPVCRALFDEYVVVARKKMNLIKN